MEPTSNIGSVVSSLETSAIKTNAEQPAKTGRVAARNDLRGDQTVDQGQRATTERQNTSRGDDAQRQNDDIARQTQRVPARETQAQPSPENTRQVASQPSPSIADLSADVAFISDNARQTEQQERNLIQQPSNDSNVEIQEGIEAQEQRDQSQQLQEFGQGSIVTSQVQTDNTQEPVNPAAASVAEQPNIATSTERNNSALRESQQVQDQIDSSRQNQQAQQTETPSFSTQQINERFNAAIQQQSRTNQQFQQRETTRANLVEQQVSQQRVESSQVEESFREEQLNQQLQENQNTNQPFANPGIDSNTPRAATKNATITRDFSQPLQRDLSELKLLEQQSQQPSIDRFV